jgi:hypothetical protein
MDELEYVYIRFHPSYTYHNYMDICDLTMWLFYNIQNHATWCSLDVTPNNIELQINFNFLN